MVKQGVDETVAVTNGPTELTTALKQGYVNLNINSKRGIERDRTFGLYTMLNASQQKH
jgi:hypothetical protein